jgi:uncharacterized protein YjiS (DUF1127 family)
MHAFRQDDCTGCAGPTRQTCKDRPGIRPLSPTLPKTTAHAAALLGDQLRFEVNGPFGGDNAEPKRAHWIARLKAGFAGFCERAVQRRRNRQIALELSRLDDRTLRDIGISRPEIEAAIARAQRGGR